MKMPSVSSGVHAGREACPVAPFEENSGLQEWRRRWAASRRTHFGIFRQNLAPMNIAPDPVSNPFRMMLNDRAWIHAASFQWIHAGSFQTKAISTTTEHFSGRALGSNGIARRE
jgi:hypothetical protein